MTVGILYQMNMAIASFGADNIMDHISQFQNCYPDNVMITTGIVGDGDRSPELINNILCTDCQVGLDDISRLAPIAVLAIIESPDTGEQSLFYNWLVSPDNKYEIVHQTMLMPRYDEDDCPPLSIIWLHTGIITPQHTLPDYIESNIHHDLCSLL